MSHNLGNSVYKQHRERQRERDRLAAKSLGLNFEILYNYMAHDNTTLLLRANECSEQKLVDLATVSLTFLWVSEKLSHWSNVSPKKVSASV